MKSLILLLFFTLVQTLSIQASSMTGEIHDAIRPLSGYNTLHWYLHCPEEPPLPTLEPTPLEPVIEGFGPHTSFLRERMVHTEIKIYGKICPPKATPRDIIFIVDVSGSMTRKEKNDPMIDGSCGRLRAIEEMFKLLPWGRVNVGIITFSTDVEKISRSLKGSAREVIESLTGRSRRRFNEAICAGISKTNYKDPLVKAERLFRRGRKNATKELFFISDGAPSDEEKEWLPIAQRLKEKGVTVNSTTEKVTIATVMLKGDEEKLKLMSSTDGRGQLLHAKVDDADKLEEVLANFANRHIIEGSRLVVHSDEIPYYRSFNVMDYRLDKYYFELPAFQLDINGSQQFYEIQFEYWNRNKDRVLQNGRIEWAD